MLSSTYIHITKLQQKSSSNDRRHVSHREGAEEPAAVAATTVCAEQRKRLRPKTAGAVTSLRGRRAADNELPDWEELEVYIYIYI